MKRNRTVLCLMVVLVITALLVGCGGAKTTPVETTPPVTTQSTPTGKSIYDGTYTGTFIYEYQDFWQEKPGNYPWRGPWIPADFELTITLKAASHDSFSADVRPYYCHVTSVHSSEPGLDTGLGVGSGGNRAQLPGIPPSMGTGIYIDFANGAKLQTSTVLSADEGRTLWNDPDTNPDDVTGTWWADAPTGRFKTTESESGGRGEIRRIRFKSWSLTKVSSELDTGSITGKVWCQPEGLQWVAPYLWPLTTDVADNPENAKVTISGPVSRMTEVDKEGAFRFDNLPPGSYQVTASARWYISQTKMVAVPSGQGVAVDPFFLGRGKGTIKGRVLHGGEGVGRAIVRAVNKSTLVVTQPLYVEADGSYTMEVPAGNYMVKAGLIDPGSQLWTLVDAYNAATNNILVETNATVTHDIVLSP